MRCQMFRAEDQIVSLMRIFLEIIELIDVPDAIVMDVFIPAATQRVHGLSLREVPLRCAYLPVSIAARLGEHSAVVTKGETSALP